MAGPEDSLLLYFYVVAVNLPSRRSLVRNRLAGEFPDRNTYQLVESCWTVKSCRGQSFCEIVEEGSSQRARRVNKYIIHECLPCYSQGFLVSSCFIPKAMIPHLAKANCCCTIFRWTLHTAAKLSTPSVFGTFTKSSKFNPNFIEPSRSSKTAKLEGSILAIPKSMMVIRRLSMSRMKLLGYISP